MDYLRRPMSFDPTGELTTPNADFEFSSVSRLTIEAQKYMYSEY